MKGRLRVRIPLEDIVCIKEDQERGLLNVILESDDGKYPAWTTGSEAQAIAMPGDILEYLKELDQLRVRDREWTRIKQAVKLIR